MNFNVMKRITFLISSLLLLVACNNEVEQNFNIPETDAQQIKLNLPDAAILTYSTATPDECQIDNLWVLEFNTGGTLVNNTLILGANIVNKGHATQMLPPLPFKPANGNTIVLLANTGVTSLPAGVTYANINASFPLGLGSPHPVGYYVEGESLPMYGEITDWPGTNAYSCDMIRAVAKIQVRLGETFIDETGSGNWPDNVTWQVGQYALSGLIQPASTVTGVLYAAGGMYYTTPKFCLLQTPQTSTASHTAYFFEYNSSVRNIKGEAVGATTFDSLRSCVYITEGGNRYYRLDFYDAYATSPTYKQFVDIKRNCHYIFTINKVGSSGYRIINEAFHLPGSNIEYTVEAPNGFDYVTSNGQYAIVTSVDTAYVAANTANDTIATAKYVLPAEMTSLNTSPNTIMATGTGLTLNEPAPPAKLTDMNQNIVVTATSSFTQGTIEFNLGNVTHTLVVMKK